MDKAGLNIALHKPEIPKVFKIIQGRQRVPNLHHKDKRVVHREQAISVHKLRAHKVVNAINSLLGGFVAGVDIAGVEQDRVSSGSESVPVVSEHVSGTVCEDKGPADYGLYQGFEVCAFGQADQE